MAKSVLPESQYGFSSESSTITVIFAARQLLQPAREHQNQINFAFIDLCKALNTAYHEITSFSEILQKSFLTSNTLMTVLLC